ncbi:MAG: hypothetical protein ACK5GN_14330 [Pseudomonadota bacterium]
MTTSVGSCAFTTPLILTRCLPLKKRYSAMLSDDLPASSNNMHLILSQEARIALQPELLLQCFQVPAKLKTYSAITGPTLISN